MGQKERIYDFEPWLGGSKEKGDRQRTTVKRITEEPVLAGFESQGNSHLIEELL